MPKQKLGARKSGKKADRSQTMQSYQLSSFGWQLVAMIARRRKQGHQPERALHNPFDITSYPCTISTVRHLH